MVSDVIYRRRENIKKLVSNRKIKYLTRRECKLYKKHEMSYDIITKIISDDPWFILDKLEYYLEVLDEFYPRTTQQIECHKFYLAALLPQIFGDSLESNRERLYRRFQITEINNIVCVSAGRRTGKTFSICFLCAVILLVMDSCDIVIFAIASRQSRAIPAMVKIMLSKISGDEDRIIVCNMETLTVKNIFHLTNTMKSLPGASDVSIHIYFFYFIFGGENFINESISFSVFIESHNLGNKSKIKLIEYL